MNKLSFNLQNKSVYGVGAALVDLLAREELSWITQNGAKVGDMQLVDSARSRELVANLSGPAVEVPGGSACNTLVGISLMGGSTKFVGRVGNDRLGNFYGQYLKNCKVKAQLSVSNNAETGRVLSVVTPDAQRTMFTLLGASQLDVEDLPEIDDSAGLVHVEGYLAFNEKVFRKVMQQAKRANVPVCLDLASVSVVHFCRALLQETLDSGAVHILVANEDEGAAWSGCGQVQEIISLLRKSSPVAILKLGARGALVAQSEEIFSVQAPMVKAMDTTGAGDLWAAGLLRGLQMGWDLQRATRLAAAVAAEVVQVMGTIIPQGGWDRVAQTISKLEHAR